MSKLAQDVERCWSYACISFVHRTVEVHEDQVEVNKAQVEVYKVQVEVHKAEVDVHAGKVELHKGQVDVHEPQVELHGAFCRPTSVICTALPTFSSMSRLSATRGTYFTPGQNTV